MIEQLLDCGVPADNAGDRNPLAAAIVNNDYTSVHLLLLFGAQRWLHTALLSNPSLFFEAAELLLKYGTDPNVSAGHYDETPYARAFNSGQTTFVELYLKHCASSDAIMANGNTSSIQAIIQTVSIKHMGLMLMCSADPNHKNAWGETALFRAISTERLDIVAALIDHEANPYLPGPKHMLWPAVHQPQILEHLLERAADLQRAPGVLELATSINWLHAVSILLKCGINWCDIPVISAFPTLRSFSCCCGEALSARLNRPR
jgi:ankyrin repeat protein